MHWLRKSCSAWSSDGLGRLPPALQERAGAADHGDHAVESMVNRAAGRFLRRRATEWRRVVGGSGGRPMCGLHGQRPGDSRGLAGLERQQAARASGSRRRGSARSSTAPPPPTSTGRSASGRGPRPGSRRGCGNCRPRSRSNDRCQRSDSRACRAVPGMVMPSGPSKRAQECEPVVDVAADQELGRCQPLELQGFGGRCSLGRFQIGLRRLGPAAGVGQCVSQFFPEQPRLAVGPWYSSSATR